MKDFWLKHTRFVVSGWNCFFSVRNWWETYWWSQILRFHTKPGEKLESYFYCRKWVVGSWLGLRMLNFVRTLFLLHFPSWSIFWGARTFWPTSKERRWWLSRLSEVSRWSGVFRAAHETILSAPGNGFPFPFQPRSLTILLRPNLLEYWDTWLDTFIISYESVLSPLWTYGCTVCWSHRGHEESSLQS